MKYRLDVTDFQNSQFWVLLKNTFEYFEKFKLSRWDQYFKNLMTHFIISEKAFQNNSVTSRCKVCIRAPRSLLSTREFKKLKFAFVTHLSDLVHYDDTNPAQQNYLVNRRPRFMKRKQNYKSVQS